ncbi:9730_t:CDS:2 [Gigaspora rosea]|nr:9730_t:CDS:2 [Gigaspora rosea]
MTQTQESEEFNIVSENDPDFFKSFIESIKYNYENGGSQLQLVFEKFAERYNVAKSKSTLALTSFLYNINRNADLLTRIKNGAKIHVQVESVKHQKTNKENVDPQVIPARKVQKVGKKAHSLSQNIKKN